MQITITARELMDLGKWDSYCDLTGMNPWAVNEGRMTSDEILEISLADAIKLGLLEDN